MDFLTCAIINGPFVALNIMMNLFYVFCILYPPHGERIKQPQKLLLCCVIFCAVIYLPSGLLLLSLNVTAENLHLFLALCIVQAWSLCTSMDSIVWLNFFYCTQIVPAQRALFIWIKKNIKHIIYCAWLWGRVFGFLYVGVVVFENLITANLLHVSLNDTVSTNSVCIQVPHSVLKIYEVTHHTVQVNFLLHVCVMMLSNASTVIYLGKHTRRMLANRQSLSCPNFRGEVRVTVIGILQGLLFFLCCVSTVFFDIFSKGSLNLYYTFTVVNLYVTGSSLSLGAVQSVFRLRLEAIWLRLTQVIRPRLPK